MNTTRAKKISLTVANGLVFLFLIVCVLTVLFVLLGRNERDGGVEVFGYRLLIVTTDSMAESEETDVSGYEIGSLPSKTLIFVKTVPEDREEAKAFYEGLREGDVLTFRYVYTNQITITHRLIDKEPKDGGYILTLMGDNKSSQTHLSTQTIDTTEFNSMNYVIGKVTGSSFLLGSILSFLKTPLALVLFIILPCLAIMIHEIVKLVRLAGAEKREREEKERAAKEEEILALRQKIAALEAEATQKNGEERSEET